LIALGILFSAFITIAIIGGLFQGASHGHGSKSPAASNPPAMATDGGQDDSGSGTTSTSPAAPATGPVGGAGSGTHPQYAGHVPTSGSAAGGGPGRLAAGGHGNRAQQ
jgi:hypothetical protein